MDEMRLLLRNALIFDPQSSFHGKKINLLLENGFISKIGKAATAQKEIDLSGAWVCPGLLDMNANYREPGFEFKEDIDSGTRVAISGGFSKVVLSPSTNPIVETKSDVEFIKSKSKGIVEFLPLAALSEGMKGEDMTEILDLNEAGAVAFSDGNRSIWNNELLLKALQYVQKFDGLIISRPKDPHLSRNTHMHEGKASTMLGLKGEPSISEKIQISQQLEILRYAGGRIHFSMISTEDGLKEIKAAKKEGLRVTCDVAVNHLVFTDQHVSGFDTRFKMDPPFRTEKDRKALIKGVNEGVIDVIVSGHEPQDRESKYLEFDLAEAGAISQQTTFSALMSINEQIDMEVAIERLTHGPRKILGIESARIEEGQKADLAIFDSKGKWIMNAQTNKSKSENTPFWGREMIGKCVGVVNNYEVEIDM